MIVSKPMDKKSEQRLLDAVRGVAAFVESGDSPTAAVIKVATDLQLPADMVKLAVQAYNVGRTTWQQEHGGEGILNKQAEFPIARLEDVMQVLYPSAPPTPAQEKAAEAVSDAYSRPPSLPASGRGMTKAAEFKLPPPAEKPGNALTTVNRALGKAAMQKRSMEEVRREAGQLRDHLLASLGQVRDYFKMPVQGLSTWNKQAAFLRLPFAEVEYNAGLLFGAPARAVLDFAHKEARLNEKRASVPPRLLSEARKDAAPYNLIGQAIQIARSAQEKYAQLVQLEKEASSGFVETLRPFSAAPASQNRLSILDSPSTSGASSQKEAGFLSSVLGAGIGSSVRGFQQRSDPRETAVQKAELGLTDPDHIEQLREIETQVMLNNLLQNDEVLAGADPDEVLAAYNEIARMAPHVAQQPAALRPLLRRQMMQSGLESFEAAELANLERSLSQTGVHPQIPEIPDMPAKPAVPGGQSRVLSGNPLLS